MLSGNLLIALLDLSQSDATLTLSGTLHCMSPKLLIATACELVRTSAAAAAAQVLYQLFDWPNQPGSRLAVIGISNTHDLDQRVLPRIASRLDQAKLAFAPYSVAQLQTIVGQRLQESGVAGAVEDMAVMLTCRKVASETGGHVLACRDTLWVLRNLAVWNLWHVLTDELRTDHTP